MTRQLLRADVVFGDNKAVWLMKWSKTIQDRVITKTITIPHLGNSISCRVTAIMKLLCLTLGGPNDPLFQVYKRGAWIPLTDYMARKYLKFLFDQL